MQQKINFLAFSLKTRQALSSRTKLLLHQFASSWALLTWQQYVLAPKIPFQLLKASFLVSTRHFLSPHEHQSDAFAHVHLDELVIRGVTQPARLISLSWSQNAPTYCHYI
jgi:hypothetical protein